MNEKMYHEAEKIAGGCPIEAGLMLKLADNECEHGRLPGDRTEPCGCFGGVELTVLDVFKRAPRRRRRRRVAKLDLVTEGGNAPELPKVA